MKTYTNRNHTLTRTLLIAAVITAMLCTSVFAAGAIINSPDKAWQVAQEEIQAMKDLGILVPDLEMSAEPERLFPNEAETGNDYWFGRIWNHRYTVGSSTEKYYLNTDVDTFTGKITRLSIEATADESDTPTGQTVEWQGELWNYYNNFDDIFPADLTVDEFCTRLATYWGFSGYTLAGTKDDSYGWDTEAPSGDLKMMDVDTSVYLTVYFDGDQSGVPMYIQKEQLPGRVYLTIGTSHLVG